MKANFKFDPDFPVIDGVGHSDKVDFFNVKGGASTNTTSLDPFDLSSHVFNTSLAPTLLTTDVNNCRFDPSAYGDANYTWASGSPDCLNCASVGDNANCRSSDRIVGSRIEVAGVVYRPAGSDTDDYSALPAAPKVFVCLVLDSETSGVALEPASFKFLIPGNGLNNANANYKSGPGVIAPDGISYRFRVLAYDVIDFAKSPETPYNWVDYANSWNTVGVPPDEVATVVTRERYSFWRTVSFGFRFDVDLNDVLVSFSGDAVDVSSVVDNSLHVYAWVFDGVQDQGFAFHGFNSVYMSYISHFRFRDLLIPRSDGVLAGADGDVVADDAPDLSVLADQSAAMAGDGSFPEAEPRRKRSKASEGFFNFRPRGDPALLSFPDDFEFSRLKSAKRGKPRRATGRPFKSYRVDEDEGLGPEPGNKFRKF